MKIGISTRGFWPGKIGGAEMYLRNLVSHLQSCDHVNEYTLLCDEAVAGEFPLKNEAFEIKITGYRKSSPKKLLRSVFRAVSTIDILRAEPRYFDFDIVHHPLSLFKPTWGKFPSVLTIYDIQHEYFPEFFAAEELVRRRKAYLDSARRATRIIAISKFTRDSLVAEYGIEPDRIDVVFLGHGPEYHPRDEVQQLQALRDRYELSRPFMIYPAATWPHKNHETLLKALRVLVNDYRFDGDLVLTGIAVNSFDKLRASAQAFGVGNHLKILNFIPSDHMPLLYNLASLMVFPSLFEGFGLPVVEAMASGCPVACSNVTSIPEVAGEAAVMFDPKEAEGIAAAVARVWSDSGFASTLRCRGIERASHFSWQNTANKTIDVYRRAV
ncbi:glycosyltransferase family 4 protein [Geobacter pickeringii]|uniref:glycosyltransferase family 4 protein n=1 Tax=Geobacter pickeringii TaxID=345632 RepID=UPI0009FC54C3|nr:glycosyltransferase family 1 protein [Geobacter pickeringii]